MHTAMRLVRPQDIATESLASVSQLVRTEVDQLVGGVEHAVQRASELESVVHKEVANIERAFGANEERIRLMLEGLEHQRNSLHETGRVIGVEATPLLARIEENTQSLSGIISTASSTLAALEHGLKKTTSELSQTVDEISTRASFVGTEISGQTTRMEQMSGTLVNEMRVFSDSVTGQVSTMQETAQRMNTEGMHFGDSLRQLEGSVTSGIRESLEEVRSVRAELAQGIEHATSATTEQMRLAAEQNTEMMKLTGDGVAHTVRSTSGDIIQSVQQSTQAVTEQLQAAVEQNTEMMKRTGDGVAHTVRSTSGEIMHSVQQSTQAVNEQLQAAAEQNTEMMKLTGDKVAQSAHSTSGEIIHLVQQSSQSVTNSCGPQLNRTPR